VLPSKIGWRESALIYSLFFQLRVLSQVGAPVVNITFRHPEEAYALIWRCPAFGGPKALDVFGPGSSVLNIRFRS